MIDRADPEREALRADEVRRVEDAFRRGVIGQDALRASLVGLGLAARDAAAEIELLKMDIDDRRPRLMDDVQLQASRDWLHARGMQNEKQKENQENRAATHVATGRR